MKKISLFIFILLFAKAFSQQDREAIASGSITMRNSEVVNFKNLHWEKGKAFYLNTDNGQNEELYDNSIIKITDSGNKVVFENKDIKTSETKNTPYKKPEEKAQPKEYKNKLGYPEGIYETKEFFIRKTPSSTLSLTKKGLIGFEKKPTGDEDVNAFFYNSDDKKLKNIFAIVYHGDLYFGIEAILSNRNKTDRAQSSDFPNSFVKTKFGGQNYIYLEVTLANAWAKGFSSNMGIYGMDDYLKGVVWDIKNQEFNIFKNCQDFNLFINDKYPDASQTCQNQQPNLNEVQAALMIIK